MKCCVVLSDGVFYCVILCGVMFVMKVVLFGAVCFLASSFVVRCRVVFWCVVSCWVLACLGYLMPCHVLCYVFPCHVFNYVGFCFV